MSGEKFGYLTARDGVPLYAAYHGATQGDGGAVYHAPGGGQSGAPVLMCPPLFEERKSAYGALRKLALKLAAAGHAVLRFDYRGSGESGGDSATRRWAHLAEDLATVREALARMSGGRDVVLLGLRLGATLALQEAARANATAVVALAPIIAGSAQVRQWRMRSKIRAELTDGGTGVGITGVSPVSPGQDAHATLDFDGYEVHPGFFDDVAAIGLLKAASLACPALVVQISHRTDASSESAQLVSALGAKAKLECLRLEPFWEKLDDVDTTPVEDVVLNWVSGYRLQVSGSTDDGGSNLKLET